MTSIVDIWLKLRAFILEIPIARIKKKYLKISRKFITLMTSYRETNIAKEKIKLEFHSNH